MPYNTQATRSQLGGGQHPKRAELMEWFFTSGNKEATFDTLKHCKTISRSGTNFREARFTFWNEKEAMQAFDHVSWRTTQDHNACINTKLFSALD